MRNPTWLVEISETAYPAALPTLYTIAAADAERAAAAAKAWYLADFALPDLDPEIHLRASAQPLSNEPAED